MQSRPVGRGGRDSPVGPRSPLSADHKVLNHPLLPDLTLLRLRLPRARGILASPSDLHDPNPVPICALISSWLSNRPTLLHSRRRHIPAHGPPNDSRKPIGAGTQPECLSLPTPCPAWRTEARGLGNSLYVKAGAGAARVTAGTGCVYAVAVVAGAGVLERLGPAHRY